MRPAISSRSDVAAFLAMDVFADAKVIAAQGHSIIHMEVGEPGTPAPASVRAAVEAALRAGPVPYTQALGLPSLRTRIAAHYAETYGVTIPAERVVVTTGSSAGFMLAFLACFEVGARVAIPAPGYPAYRNILTALGLVPVEIETGPATRYALTAELVAAAHAEQPLHGVLAMSPANPTGVMTGDAELKALAKTCERLGLWFVSDEIYHGLTYERPAASALEFSDGAIVVNSFSKFYCMTGWRVGWLVVPERMVRAAERLSQNLYISAPYLSQIGAEAAFEAKAELLAIKAGYEANRALLLERLPGIGLTDILPMDGAFYAYVDVGRFSNDAVDFCKRALREAHVAITPGIDFDLVGGARKVRLSYAGSHASVTEGVERLGRWLG